MVLKTEHTGMCSDDIMYATQLRKGESADLDTLIHLDESCFHTAS